MDSADRIRKRAWKEAQRASARVDFPLADEVLEKLFADVDAAVELTGCDHTLRFTERILTMNGNDLEPTMTWLKAHGGFCDCEVVANACDYWEENR